jgi:hypothetical protein
MITNETYFKTNNKALTNSKIKDFNKDKNFFHRKHVKADFPVTKKSDALIIGSAVDTWLTESRQKFELLYQVVPRRNTDADDYEYQLTQTMYDEIVGICKSVEGQDAYKELADYKKQAIIQFPMDLGEHFNCLCGKPDWYRIWKDADNRVHCTIVDLKTAADADEKTWLYHCLKYGYFDQQGQYQNILALLHPEIEFFHSFHLVVEKDADDIYNCETFELAQDRIDMCRKKLEATYQIIRNTTDWSRKNVSLANAKLIGSLIME